MTIIRQIVLISIFSSIFGINSMAVDIFTKINNINKGKYVVQVDSLNNFLNYLKCDDVIISENKNTIGCYKNSDLYYLIFKNKKEFKNLCTNGFKGIVEDKIASNKWVHYSLCVNKSENKNLVSTKTKVLEDKKDIYIVSLRSETAMSENEPLLLYFMETVINSKENKLILNK